MACFTLYIKSYFKSAIVDEIQSVLLTASEHIIGPQLSVGTQNYSNIDYIISCVIINDSLLRDELIRTTSNVKYII